MPSNYTGPITTVAPSLFDQVADLTGRFLLTSDGKRVAWTEVLNILQAAGFFDELFFTAGAGITITGSATEDSPLVISSSASAGTEATIVVAQNLSQLQGVGNANAIYFVFDTDGQGTNGIYAWNETASAYQSMTPSGAGGGSATVRSDISSTNLSGKVRHQGGAPVLTGSAGAYTLTVPTGCDLKGFRLMGVTAATDGSQTLTLTIVNTDGESEYGIFDVLDQNGRSVNEQSVSIEPVYSEPSTGSVQVIFSGIGAFASFTIMFSSCA
ncbi:MAG: hypothetical protein AAFO91_01290 [Bacteroidota bacterium]